ncbi:MAG: FAD-binding oxidoreductase [Planctomycetaceae bacterium]|nr:FAD-binding oxidoreductase [Planctomycetaceae bacterium]
MSDVTSDPPQLTPTCETEVIALIKESYEQSRAIVVTGGGHFETYGYPLDSNLAKLSTVNLNQVIDYPSRDMTITVEAGMSIAALQHELAKEGQRLPIDVPCAETATVGGAIAANVFGSRGYQLGTWRDYLLGFSAVDGQGRLFKAGGRVVKNVAGYDLGKLMIGSHGTLAALTQMTLKVKPIPETGQFLYVGLKESEIETYLSSLVRTETIPVSVDLITPEMANLLSIDQSLELPIEFGLLIGFEGTPREVAWQLEKIQTEINTVGKPGVMFAIEEQFTDAVCKGLSETLSSWKSLSNEDQVKKLEKGHSDFRSSTYGNITFQASLKPSAIEKFVKTARTQGCVMQSLVQFGIVRGLLPDMNTAAQVIGSLREELKKFNGSLVVIQSGPQWDSTIDPFDYDSLMLTYMRKIKEKLDPRNILAPGKLFK